MKEDIVTTAYDSPIPPMLPRGRPTPNAVRQAIDEIHALRRELARRPSFKPLTNKEIHDAIRNRRP